MNKIFKNKSGTSNFQISLLTKKINFLHSHFITHKKDHSSRRGLLKMVSIRRKLLNYLKKKDYLTYSNLIKNLGLRY
ncbi:30S ribosomal protein S15 [Buchnera aphidicola]|uniref:Small ribosomal subunit protein uS15 n=1 Tax=Buchnera aphidicola subsp. Tuberolachnus salignus TaxID=98804 RepID=A0A160SWL4_BUCTT|nr:30S ribosomal protein S15 [Buchnera aphidicola]CUR53222.1 30S ribosomal protein S15 [Buchnera aphidicola (Tuberolachnus salignus)]